MDSVVCFEPKKNFSWEDEEGRRPKYSPLPTPSNGSLGSNIEAGEDQRRHQGQKEETKQR